MWTIFLQGPFLRCSPRRLFRGSQARIRRGQKLGERFCVWVSLWQSPDVSTHVRVLEQLSGQGHPIQDNKPLVGGLGQVLGDKNGFSTDGTPPNHQPTPPIRGKQRSKLGELQESPSLWHMDFSQGPPSNVVGGHESPPQPCPPSRVPNQISGLVCEGACLWIQEILVAHTDGVTVVCG